MMFVYDGGDGLVRVYTVFLSPKANVHLPLTSASQDSFPASVI